MTTTRTASASRHDYALIITERESGGFDWEVYVDGYVQDSGTSPRLPHAVMLRRKQWTRIDLCQPTRREDGGDWPVRTVSVRLV